MKVSRITLYSVSLDVGTNLTRYAADQSRFSIETMIVRLELTMDWLDGRVLFGAVLLFARNCQLPPSEVPFTERH
jgi:hypothetical protein